MTTMRDQRRYALQQMQRCCEKRNVDPVTVSAEEAARIGESFLSQDGTSAHPFLAEFYSDIVFKGIWDEWRRTQLVGRAPAHTAHLWNGGGTSFENGDSTTMVMVEVPADEALEGSILAAIVSADFPALLRLFLGAPDLLQAALALLAYAPTLHLWADNDPTGKNREVHMAIARLNNVVRGITEEEATRG